VPGEAEVAPGALDAAALRRLWSEILDVVKRTSRRTRALLDSAQIVVVDRDLVQLSAPAALARMIADPSNTAALARALTDVVGGEWRVEVIAADEAARSDGTARHQAANGAGTPSTQPEVDPGEDADEVDDAAGLSAVTPGPVPTDPEAEALKLLEQQLGARPLEQS
jgi:DNA polymerase-3 subunit gamma/tau